MGSLGDPQDLRAPQPGLGTGLCLPRCGQPGWGQAEPEDGTASSWLPSVPGGHSDLQVMLARVPGQLEISPDTQTHWTPQASLAFCPRYCVPTTERASLGQWSREPWSRGRPRLLCRPRTNMMRVNRTLLCSSSSRTHTHTRTCAHTRTHTREHGLGGRADTTSGRPQDVEIPLLGWGPLASRSPSPRPEMGGDVTLASCP